MTTCPARQAKFLGGGTLQHRLPRSKCSLAARKSPSSEVAASPGPRNADIYVSVCSEAGHDSTKCVRIWIKPMQEVVQAGRFD